jgi:2-polyprenyl-3-methyl-5-hydroxy-6-metoxy-1,4-benzoquinol methylase
MTTDKIPHCFTRALDVLDVRPSDELLEVGCGHGILLSLVAERLTTENIAAIARSGKMIATATRRNAAQIAAAKVTILEATLATAELHSRLFDKIFAFNVNVFWMDPRGELAVARTLLKPDGTSYQFFDPPSATRAKPIAASSRPISLRTVLLCNARRSPMSEQQKPSA